MTGHSQHIANVSQPHTLPSRTSQRTNQSLSKSVSVPTHRQKSPVHNRVDRPAK